jgi:hypothetical protein
MHGGDGGLDLVGANRAFGRVAVTSAMPSAICARSHRRRSCLVSGISSPPGPVPRARRASVNSMSASNPATSPSSGKQVMNGPRQADRFADSSLRRRFGRSWKCSLR